MAGIFKAYDIRGIYGRTLTDETARLIGRAFAEHFRPRTVVVGRDIRRHSARLAGSLTEGLTCEGVRVIRLGLCSTPMCYFANGRLDADGGIMVTASHNPAEWNGFKLCGKGAAPVSEHSGIRQIEALVARSTFAPRCGPRGTVVDYDPAPDYAKHVAAQFSIDGPVHLAADFANAMGILEAKALDGAVTFDALFDEFDGSFPNHEANPLKAETLAALCAKVRAGRYDFGVAFDGDADRVGFVDERGDILRMDLVTALIAGATLRARGPAPILYDLRSSWAVREEIAANGGTPVMTRVGHSFIKKEMRERNALFAGELSGHYYFRENYSAESAAMAVLAVAALLRRTGKPLSELVRPLRRYHATGEVNLQVADAASAIRTLRQHYRGGRETELDGLSVEFADWWFNVRRSNTEPDLLRLNLEAKTEALMDARRAEVVSLLHGVRAAGREPGEEEAPAEESTHESRNA